MGYKLEQSKDAIAENIIPPAYIDKHIDAPHCVMGLSIRHWNRMKDNSINLSGYRVNKVKKHKTVAYNEVTYGSNVKPMKKRLMSNGVTIFSNEINLSKMVGKYV